MTTEQKIIKTKVGVLLTLSRRKNGEEGLKEISRREPNLRNRMAPELEAAIVTLAISEPAWGQLWVANELAKRGQTVSPAGVRVVCAPRLNDGAACRHEFTFGKPTFDSPAESNDTQASA